MSYKRLAQLESAITRCQNIRDRLAVDTTLPVDQFNQYVESVNSLEWEMVLEAEAIKKRLPCNSKKSDCKYHQLGNKKSRMKDSELIEMVRNLDSHEVATINSTTGTDTKMIAEGMLDYVNVMPHKFNQYYNPGELNGEEIYALRTAGYRRNEPSDSKKQVTNPAPAKPEMVRDVETQYVAGDPFNQVYRDRLNSDQRFDSYIRNQELKGQDKLNDVLDSARSKSGMDLGMVQRQRMEIEQQRREQIKKLQAMTLPQAAAATISQMGR